MAQNLISWKNNVQHSVFIKFLYKFIQTLYKCIQTNIKILLLYILGCKLIHLGMKHDIFKIIIQFFISLNASLKCIPLTYNILWSNPQWKMMPHGRMCIFWCTQKKFELKCVQDVKLMLSFFKSSKMYIEYTLFWCTLMCQSVQFTWISMYWNLLKCRIWYIHSCKNLK